MLCKNCQKEAGKDRIKVPKIFCNRECMKAWNYRQGSFITKKPIFVSDLPRIKSNIKNIGGTSRLEYKNLNKNELTSGSISLKKMEKLYKLSLKMEKGDI